MAEADEGERGPRNVMGNGLAPALAALAVPLSPWIPLVAAQLAFGILGAWAAHAMFDLQILQLSTKARTGFGQGLGEAIAWGLELSRHKHIERPARKHGVIPV